MIWSFTRIFVPSGSGRQRYSVLGAVETRDHDFVSIRTPGSINAEVVCELLEKISATYPGEEITLVMKMPVTSEADWLWKWQTRPTWSSFTFQPIPPTLISLNVSGVSSKPDASGTNGVHVFNKLRGHRGISVGPQFDLAKLVRLSWVGP
jgi:hypothetical protein